MVGSSKPRISRPRAERRRETAGSRERKQPNSWQPVIVHTSVYLSLSASTRELDLEPYSISLGIAWIPLVGS